MSDAQIPPEILGAITSGHQLPPGLARVLPALRCPVCQERLRPDGRRLLCASGHSFDLARQGYAGLTRGRTPGTGDTAAMVQAREAFLGAGHYRPIAERITELVARLTRERAVPDDGLVVDLAGGTGYYLAAVLDAGPGLAGICVDLSAAALRRAARVHPRAAAIGADVWGRLPLADGSVSVALNVFGPRDVGELARVLAPDGVLVTVSPQPQHLTELVGALGLVGVDPDKDERRAAAFAWFAPLASSEVGYTLQLGHDDVAAVAGMGPSAAHLDADELAVRVAALPEPVKVTVAVRVESYRPPLA